MGRCSACDEPGHNVRTCTRTDVPGVGGICGLCNEVGHVRPSCPKLPESQQALSVRAARWMKEHGTTLAAAGEKFGISRQAVNQVWDRLGFGATPLQARSASVDDRIIAIARDGLTAKEVVAKLVAEGVEDKPGLWGRVYAVCHAQGVELTPAPSILDRKGDAVAAVIARIRTGELTVAAAAAEIDVHETWLYNVLRDAKVDRGARHRRGHDYRRKMPDGRPVTAHASDLIDRGHTVKEAAHVFRIAANSVRSYRKRHGLWPLKTKTTTTTNNKDKEHEHDDIQDHRPDPTTHAQRTSS